MRKTSLGVAFIILGIWLIILCNCSNTSSIMPSSTPPESNLSVQTNLLNSETNYNRYLWSYHLIWVDPATNQFKLIPVREVAAHWNVLKFLEQGPCTNCVKVMGMTNSDHGTKLVVEPGVLVKFAGSGSNLSVSGILDCEGTQEKPIIFTSVKDDEADGVDVKNDGPTVPHKGDWGHIGFADSSIDSLCVLRHCQIRYGGYYALGIVCCVKASPTIDYCKIENSDSYGITANGGSPTITNCEIGYNKVGIYCNGAGGECKPFIDQCSIYGNDCGIEISDASPILGTINFYGNQFDFCY